MAAGYDTNFNGIVLISQADYNAMPSHDADTRYTVRDENGNVQEYLGDTPIGGGGSGGVITGVPVVQMSGAVLPISSTIYGTAEEVN